MAYAKARRENLAPKEKKAVRNWQRCSRVETGTEKEWKWASLETS
jgi:hypothetical protein